MSTALMPELFTRLKGARHVVLAGAGGGFDVFAALPLGVALASRGQRVTYANLSFTYLGGTDAPFLAPHVARVTPGVSGEARYFPERSLAKSLAALGHPGVVYAFEKVGVRPLREAWRALLAHEGADAVVLVDGGTDLLMHGDEAGLGTPTEDVTSLVAVAGLDVPSRFAVCVGFGIDAFHGVCHAHFLENVAGLERAGAYLGAFSVPRGSAEAQAYLDAVRAAAQEAPRRASIVNASIAAALEGQFGDVPVSERTAGSELFINPLMALYFAFELGPVADRLLYRQELEDTHTVFDVQLQIEAFRATVRARPFKALPG